MKLTEISILLYSNAVSTQITSYFWLFEIFVSLLHRKRSHNITRDSLRHKGAAFKVIWAGWRHGHMPDNVVRKPESCISHSVHMGLSSSRFQVPGPGQLQVPAPGTAAGSWFLLQEQPQVPGPGQTRFQMSCDCGPASLCVSQPR